VGCYYLAAGRPLAAVKPFTKATQLDDSFAPGWAGLGQAFAAQDEPEPALAAYRAALKLWPGSHVPALALATLCGRTGQLVLAAQYAQLAVGRCRGDPLVHHELGAQAYRLGDWEAAAGHLHTAVDLTAGHPRHLRRVWEPTLALLGHAYRKMR
jgi:tetratricopeptide (TPR) repeat protein